MNSILSARWGTTLWLALNSISRGSGKEERKLSVKYFIILSTWRLFKTWTDLGDMESEKEGEERGEPAGGDWARSNRGRERAGQGWNREGLEEGRKTRGGREREEEGARERIWSEGREGATGARAAAETAPGSPPGVPPPSPVHWCERSQHPHGHTCARSQIHMHWHPPLWAELSESTLLGRQGCHGDRCWSTTLWVLIASTEATKTVTSFRPSSWQAASPSLLLNWGWEGPSGASEATSLPPSSLFGEGCLKPRGFHPTSRGKKWFFAPLSWVQPLPLPGKGFWGTGPLEESPSAALGPMQPHPLPAWPQTYSELSPSPPIAQSSLGKLGPV